MSSRLSPWCITAVAATTWGSTGFGNSKRAARYEARLKRATASRWAL
ncbi:hypothetical protein SGM_0016 [Streptomyces griseoaurantiacus M045]|uniref:Uncharacterized protein n=1 Tax=Streptomyces griseoaurantiacus M045 TaxID=996637 RepID=F3N9I2_9ACTN|nr:hypothetical protein SGM_0016 [Streptomyces griseoaurantiacus M045]